MTTSKHGHLYSCIRATTQFVLVLERRKRVTLVNTEAFEEKGPRKRRPGQDPWYCSSAILLLLTQVISGCRTLTYVCVPECLVEVHVQSRLAPYRLAIPSACQGSPDPFSYQLPSPGPRDSRRAYKSRRMATDSESPVEGKAFSHVHPNLQIWYAPEHGCMGGMLWLCRCCGFNESWSCARSSATENAGPKCIPALRYTIRITLLERYSPFS
jgi:hypothetical protein